MCLLQVTPSACIVAPRAWGAAWAPQTLVMSRYPCVMHDITAYERINVLNSEHVR
jgi:hypothetical protein